MAGRVLILRTSALGDVVHCLPVLTALRRHLPEARLGWVVEEALAPVVAGHPDLDEVIVARLRPWRRRPFAAETRREIRAFLAALRRFAPDVALDLMGNHKAGILALLSGSPRRIGPGRHQRREPSSALWISEAVETSAVHAVDRALAVARVLGLPSEPADFGGDRLFPRVPEAAERLFAAHPKPYVLIQPGAGWGNKTWPPERWGEVARRLQRVAGLASWVAVAPGEEDLARRAAAASGGAAREVEAFDLGTLAALLRRARLVLGGDTGPTHLAHALGTPVLAVLGPTDPARHGPYGAPERALAVRLPCSFCYKRLGEAKACLLAVSPRAVTERALAILGHAAAGSAGSAERSR
jgi:lipopolysaccharide heptosyltransferase I